MGKCYFITATGTEVGKTFISSLLVSYFHDQGKSVVYYKPAETGVSGEHGADTEYIVTHNAFLKDIPREKMERFLYKLPASPHLAASCEEKVINEQLIVEDIECISREYDVVIIEGAGGLLVPLRPGLLTIDILPELDIEVILVAPAGLGMINHTLLSLEALRNRDIPVAGVVVNRYPENPGFVERDNINVINEYGNTTVIAVVPEQKDVKISISDCLTNGTPFTDKKHQ